MIYKTGSFLKITKIASAIDELDIPDLEKESEILTNAVETKDKRFVYAWTRAVTADVPNGNFDEFPLDELQKSYKTFEGRNLFLDHNTTSVAKAVGKVIQAKLLHDEKTGEFYVGCLIKIDRASHPDIASMVETGTIDSVSMGASVCEAHCNCCNTVATNTNEFCKHLKTLGRTDRESGKKHISINRGVTFTELSLVSVPADPSATIKKVWADLQNAIAKKASKEEISKMAGAKGLASAYVDYIIENHKIEEINKELIKKVILEDLRSSEHEDLVKEFLEEIEDATIEEFKSKGIEIKSSLNNKGASMDRKAEESKFIKDYITVDQWEEFLAAISKTPGNIPRVSNPTLAEEISHNAGYDFLDPDSVGMALGFYEKNALDSDTISEMNEYFKRAGMSFRIPEMKKARLSMDMNDLKSALNKLTGLDLLSITNAMDKKADPMIDGKPVQMGPLKPEAAPEMPKLDMPKQPEMPKMEPKKEEPKKDEPKKEEIKKDIEKVEKPGSPDWEKADIKSMEDVLKLLKEIESRENAEGEKSVVKELKSMVKRMESLLKEEKESLKCAEEKAKEEKEKAKKEEEKAKEEAKKAEEKAKKAEDKKAPKEEKPALEKKEEVNPESVNIIKEESMDLQPVFIKKATPEESKWIFIDKKAGKVMLRAELKPLFGDALTANLEYATTKLGADIVAAVMSQGLTKEAVFSVVAKYKPAYPTENKMDAPPVSSHPKAKEKAPADTDVEVSPLAKKAADAAIEKDTEVCDMVGPKNPKADENSSQDQSGHAKATAKPKLETDLESSPEAKAAAAAAKANVVKTADVASTPAPITPAVEVTPAPVVKVETPVEVKPEVAPVADAEKQALKKEIAQIRIENQLREKMETCKGIIELMVSKGVLKVNDGYLKTAIEQNKPLSEAKKVAFEKTVEDQIKRFLSMDNESIVAFRESLEAIDKPATKTADSTKLKSPISIQAEQNNGGNFVDWSKNLPWS